MRRRLKDSLHRDREQKALPTSPQDYPDRQRPSVARHHDRYRQTRRVKPSESTSSANSRNFRQSSAATRRFNTWSPCASFRTSVPAAVFSSTRWTTINREREMIQRALALGFRCDPPKVARLIYIQWLPDSNTRTGCLDDARCSSSPQSPAQSGLK